MIHGLITEKVTDTQGRIKELDELRVRCRKLATNEDHTCIEPMNISQAKVPFDKTFCTTCFNTYRTLSNKLEETMEEVPLFRIEKHINCHAIHIFMRKQGTNYDPELKNVSIPNPRQILDLDHEV